jgi:outer membrane lipoprotein carrier protein
VRRTLFAAVAISFFINPIESVAQCSPLGDLVDRVEARLERLRDFSADFVQRERDGLNRTVVEEGHLWVERPNKTRWEYRLPEEKLFVTDGSDVYSYVPRDRQVRHAPFDETVDDRLPIMFLLGRSDLEREFERITRPNAEPVVPGACVLDMVPARESVYESVRIEVDSQTYDLVRLVLHSGDGYSSEFVFQSVVSDEGLEEELFRFTPPPGVRLVEGL